MKLVYLLLLLFFSSCGVGGKKIDIWLSEYEQMLQKAVVLTGEERSDYEVELKNKEEELDLLLQNMSSQEQMNFLSRFYDVRLRYNNSLSIE